MKRKAVFQLPPTVPAADGKIFTVQVLETILIMNYWEDKKLIGRYCMNTKSGEYETYMAESGVWRQCKLETLCTGGSFFWYGWHKEISFQSREDKQRAVQMLQKTNDVSLFWEIHNRESDYRSEKQENKEFRRKQRIQKVMNQVPELPNEVYTWMLAQTGTKDYLFWQNKEADTWFCSLCRKVSTSDAVLKATKEQGIEAKEQGMEDKETPQIPASQTNRRGKPKIRHNDQVLCPVCKKKLQAKKRGEPKKKQRVMVFQKIDEEKSIARCFDIQITWSGGKHLFLSEGVRLILPHKPDEEVKIYYSQHFRESYSYCRQEENFDDKKNPANRMIKETLLYPGEIASALENTRYEEWIRVFKTMAQAGLVLDYAKLILASSKGLSGMIEYLFKGRFYRLLKESVEKIYTFRREYYGELNSTGCTEKEVFGIADKQKINRIRQRDGGERLVDWMRWAEKNQAQLHEETLDWLEEEKIRSTNISFITDRMSPCQVMHYVKKQQSGEYKGMNAWQVINQWRDYLSMCKREGRDTQDAMVYRPRQLKRRHDEMVEVIHKRAMLEAIERDKKEQEAFAREMAEKFPGAEENLQNVRGKFTYENETYRIIVPGRLIDIVAEGRALHHCAGATERYFERIRDNETYICFLRKKSEPEKPFYTIEVEPGGTIRQHRSMYDEEPGIEEIRGFLREWQKVIQQRMSKEDKDLARESAIKRQKNLEELRQKKNTRVLEGLLEDFMEAM